MFPLTGVNKSLPGAGNARRETLAPSRERAGRAQLPRTSGRWQRKVPWPPWLRAVPSRGFMLLDVAMFSI